jgi:ribosomal protein S18 acetylase RimI-like enzyme
MLLQPHKYKRVIPFLPFIATSSRKVVCSKRQVTGGEVAYLFLVACCGIMKRPELLMFALLRSSATALATTGEKVFLSPQTQHIQLRLATRTDVPAIQRCNLACLPENYNAEFYCSHLRQWPELALVAEELPSPREMDQQYQSRNPFSSFPGGGYQSDPKIVAYVLGKVESRSVMDYDNPTSYHDVVETLGHVTSLAVHKDFRRLGLARAMMTQLHYHLEHQNVDSCGLHVRTSNLAACRLYKEDGYAIDQVIPSYYQDGEDAYFMKKMFCPQRYSPPGYATTGPFFGKKVWKSGPQELRLPRIHSNPIILDDDMTSVSSSFSSSKHSSGGTNGGSAELLTGTI